METVFLDYNATTPPSKKVRSFLSEFDDWGNASSIHGGGRGAKSVILKTRRKLASLLGCQPGELIFNSGGSEANNMALKGVAQKIKERGQSVVLSSRLEHPSVVKTLEGLKKQGLRVLWVPACVDHGLDYGFIAEKLETEPIGLVSLMYSNNETGEVFDLEKVQALIKKAEVSKGQKIYFHSDMVQFLGKFPVADFQKLQVDLASFSAHKFYALQGVGVLYQKKGVGLEPFVLGGGQERGRRAGTENILGIGALGAQLEELGQEVEKLRSVRDLRDHLEEQVAKQITGLSVLAKDRVRSGNTSLFLIEGVHGEVMLMNLDLMGFQVSTGAACSSGNPEPSPVLLALGLSAKEASRSLRVSLGWQTTRKEIDLFVEALVKVTKKVRELSS